MKRRVYACKAGMLLWSWLLWGQVPETLQVTSEAFKDNDKIPAYYTCDNADVEKQPSPPLQWSKGPEGTKSYAIIVEDPDAPNGTYYHWLVYNIPAAVQSLAERAVITSPAIEAINSSGNTYFVGPCPPIGEHRYVFHVYALSDAIQIASNATIAEIKLEIEKRSLAHGQLIGRYSKVVKQGSTKQ